MGAAATEKLALLAEALALEFGESLASPQCTSALVRLLPSLQYRRCAAACPVDRWTAQMQHRAFTSCQAWLQMCMRTRAGPIQHTCMRASPANMLCATPCFRCSIAIRSHAQGGSMLAASTDCGAGEPMWICHSALPLV